MSPLRLFSTLLVSALALIAHRVNAGKQTAQERLQSIRELLKGKLITWNEVDEANLKLLGEGSFGKVYEASWMGAAVAVKELKFDESEGGHPEAPDTDRLADWLEEAAVQLHLTHPNVVPIYAVIFDENSRGKGPVGIIMEKMEGNGTEVLRDMLRAGDLSIPSRLRLSTDLFSGLAFLHARGVVHCDLKLYNLMMDTAGRGRLCDFGLARHALLPQENSEDFNHLPTPEQVAARKEKKKLREARLQAALDAHASRRLSALARKDHNAGGDAAAEDDNTSLGPAFTDAMRGTRRWMAPEVLQGHLPTKRSDVYSAAVTLWEIWTYVPGLTPYCDWYRGEEEDDCWSRAEVTRRVPAGSRPRLDILAPDTPPGVIVLLERAWATQRRQRPSAASAVKLLHAVARNPSMPGAAAVALLDAEAKKEEKAFARKQAAEAEARKKHMQQQQQQQQQRQEADAGGSRSPSPSPAASSPLGHAWAEQEPHAAGDALPFDDHGDDARDSDGAGPHDHDLEHVGEDGAGGEGENEPAAAGAHVGEHIDEYEQEDERWQGGYAGVEQDAAAQPSFRPRPNDVAFVVDAAAQMFAVPSAGPRPDLVPSAQPSTTPSRTVPATGFHPSEPLADPYILSISPPLRVRQPASVGLRAMGIGGTLQAMVIPAGRFGVGAGAIRASAPAPPLLSVCAIDGRILVLDGDRAVAASAYSRDAEASSDAGTRLMLLDPRASSTIATFYLPTIAALRYVVHETAMAPDCGSLFLLVRTATPLPVHGAGADHSPAYSHFTVLQLFFARGDPAFGFDDSRLSLVPVGPPAYAPPPEAPPRLTVGLSHADKRAMVLVGGPLGGPATGLGFSRALFFGFQGLGSLLGAAALDGFCAVGSGSTGRGRLGRLGAGPVLTPVPESALCGTLLAVAHAPHSPIVAALVAQDGKVHLRVWEGPLSVHDATPGAPLPPSAPTLSTPLFPFRPPTTWDPLAPYSLVYVERDSALQGQPGMHARGRPMPTAPPNAARGEDGDEEVASDSLTNAAFAVIGPGQPGVALYSADGTLVGGVSVDAESLAWNPITGELLLGRRGATRAAAPFARVLLPTTRRDEL